MFFPNSLATIVLPARKLLGHQRKFIAVMLLLVSLAPLPTIHAVSPAPDGGYSGSNTAEGDFSLNALTAGFGNTALGYQALFKNTGGSYNTATGLEALLNNTGGYDNTATGVNALLGNTTANDNTASGFQALLNNTTGADNTANGAFALQNNTTASNNTAAGFEALFTNTTGFNNTANGVSALLSNTTGFNNTATGFTALQNNTSGNSNTAAGDGALAGNTTGSNNIAFGISAGSNLTIGSNNIDVDNQGVTGDAAKIRIGKQGTQTATYVAGIYGKTVASGTKVAVMIDSTGKLGTVVSSARFKEAIQPMDKASEALLALKPVTFRYKHELDPDGTPQFGLIAEEVEKVNSDLVVRDEDGMVNTVRYEAVNAMLLNEFLKEHRKVEELRAIVSKQDETNTQQQKQIEALTVGLQQVTAQLESNIPASRIAINNH